MDLIPLETREDDAEGPELKLSPYAQKLARIQTVQVTQGALSGMKELTGTLEWNEKLLKTESAWFGGRIDKLNISYTGQYVRRGQVIAEIYSPELYATAEEWKQAKNSGNEGLKNAVFKKLQLLGMSEKDIKDLESVSSERVKQKAKHSGVVVHLGVEEGQYVKTGTSLAKLGSTSNLWAEMNVFEADLPLIKVNQKITMKTETLPGQTFAAKVEFIHPTFDAKTRTVRIRLSVKNKQKLLKPGMLVRGHVEIKSNTEKLYIPETAPLLTGKRAVVYVETKLGVYLGRVIELGPISNGYYEVISGLTAGEIVVKRGAFKIDAAMQIQAKPSMMYPQGGGVTVGHNHDDKKMPPTKMKTMKETGKPSKEKGNALSSSDQEWLNSFYSEYLRLQAALTTNNTALTMKGLGNISMKLTQAPSVLDVKHGNHYASNLMKTAQSEDIEEARKNMIFVSSMLIEWFKKRGFIPSKKAQVYFCPMANTSKGAEWLQDTDELKNPFMGDNMLGCGEKREVLGPQGGH
jgi:membrane fusion protein, copper/silver efflux system